MVNAPRAPPAAYKFGEVQAGSRTRGGDVVGVFLKKLTPAALIWLTPAETRWFSVPFELHDVALP